MTKLLVDIMRLFSKTICSIIIIIEFYFSFYPNQIMEKAQNIVT
jgi:hypothetical protein